MKLPNLLTWLLFCPALVWSQSAGTTTAQDPLKLFGNERITQLSSVERKATDYRLGPGDLIRVHVFGIDEFDHTIRLTPTGDIKLPYLGRLRVAGQTAGELEDTLTDLLEGQVIKDPEVFVRIKEYKAHTIFVLGAVNRPGDYKMDRELTLIDVIAMAGGLDLFRAGDQVLIQRQGPTADLGAAGEFELIRVDLKQLLAGQSQSHNPTVKDGDVVQVPPRVEERYFVMGEVNQPGVFALPGSKDILLSQALAWAGGPSRTAKLKDGTLVRYQEDGTREDLGINLQAILSGKQPDLALEPNDIIFIPGSGFKTFTYGMLGLLRNVPSSAAVRTIP